MLHQRQRRAKHGEFATFANQLITAFPGAQRRLVHEVVDQLIFFKPLMDQTGAFFSAPVNFATLYVSRFWKSPVIRNARMQSKTKANDFSA